MRRSSSEPVTSSGLIQISPGCSSGGEGQWTSASVTQAASTKPRGLHWDLFTHAVSDDHRSLLASLNHAALRSPDGQTCLGLCDLRILRSTAGCDNSDSAL